MRSNTRSILSGVLATVLALGAMASPAAAQNAAAFVAGTSPTTSSAAPASGAQDRRILVDILKDQRDIWTSPFRLGKGDAKWLIPSLLITAALIGSDKEVNANISSSHDSIVASNRVSNLGSGYVLYGASGALYLAGRLTRNDRARETGLLATEALVDQFVVVSALKAGTNRERPNKTNGRQDFYDGGSAFPSGHAAASWSFAAVVAEQYPDKPLVRWGAYGVATAVSVARVTATKHSPSDVFVGAAIGYLIGRHVAKRAAAGDAGTSFTISPVTNASTRTYGVAGTFRF